MLLAYYGGTLENDPTLRRHHGTCKTDSEMANGATLLVAASPDTSTQPTDSCVVVVELLKWLACRKAGDAWPGR